MPLDRTVAHLTRLYAHPDPWGHLTQPYEREKYARTLQSLGGRRFRHGIEVGCGIGALSALLAPRCARLTCVECVPSALDRARRRLAAVPQVRFVEGVAPDDLPLARPDLIVLSEVLYFMTPDEIARLGRWLSARAKPQSVALVVTWKGDTGEALSGDSSVRHLARALPGWSQRRASHDDYWIDRFTPS